MTVQNFSRMYIYSFDLFAAAFDAAFGAAFGAAFDWWTKITTPIATIAAVAKITDDRTCKFMVYFFPLFLFIRLESFALSASESFSCTFSLRIWIMSDKNFASFVHFFKKRSVSPYLCRNGIDLSQYQRRIGRTSVNSSVSSGASLIEPSRENIL